MYALAYSHSGNSLIAILSSISYHELIENRMFQITIRNQRTRIVK